MGDAVEQPGVTTRLGSYEILRALARGGMAELFLARATGPEGFEKLVVLKKILPTHAANPKFVRLFLDEAKLAATFDHPSIAHVYDMGMVDGNYFFTMEFVHGQDVRNILRRTERMRRQLPIEHAVQIARSVAAALHYAHERRRPDGTLLDVVHRDVSPSNVVISYDGAVKLLDFGVAKAATSSTKTRTGTLKGKIGYMSPEQSRGSAIDRRSDIFSLGILLWEMVSTRRLFKGDNDLATLQYIINTDAPPLAETRHDCPPELARIAARALARDRDARYATAEELQLDLEELARENRLGQSSIALSKHMNGLFAAEIELWKNAQASGITLTQHVAGSGGPEMMTPVSSSESQFEEVDEDDVPPPPASHRPPTAPLGAGSVIPRGDHTPIPVPRIDHTSMPGQRIDHTPMPRPPLMTPSSISVVSAAGSTPSAQFEAPLRQPTATGFPTAPREWLPPEDAPPAPVGPVVDRAPRSPRRATLWVVGGVIAAVAVLAIVVGGRGSSHRAASDAGGGGATIAPVTAPFVPTSAVDTAAAPPVDAAVAGVIDTAVAGAPDAAAAAPARASTDAGVVAPKPATTQPHAAPPPPPPPAPPPPGHQPLPGRTMPKLDHPAPQEPPTSPKRYNPDSALPPP